MSKWFKFFLSLAIGLAIFLFVIFQTGLEAVVSALSLFFSLEGLIFIGFSFLFLLIGIFKWQFILRVQGEKFSFRELAPLWLLCFSISYLTPVAVFGGEVFRIYFFKKKFPQVKWEKAMSSVAVDKILDATVFFGFLLIGMLVFAFYGRFPTSLGGVLMAVSAGVFLFLLGLFYFRRWQKKSVLEWLLNRFGVKKESVSNGSIFGAEQEVFHFFSPSSKAFWQALFLTILRYLMLVLETVFLIFFLTGSFSFLKALAVFGFITLANLTPFPASLGALEIGQGLAFSILGLGFNAGAVFSMVFRGTQLLFVLFGLIFVIKFGALFLEDKIFKKIGR